MKKIYLFCAAVALCASVVVTLCLKSEKSNFLFEANIEALAGIENPIETCDTWCYMWYSGLCVLETSAGFDINCIDMNPRNSFIL